MYCPCFQIVYVQQGSVSDANARLPKMSAIENTIPISTVFIGKLLANPGTFPWEEHVKNAPLVVRHRSRALYQNMKAYHQELNCF